MDYIYKAKTEGGQAQEGVISARDETTAISALQKKALFVMNIKKAGSEKSKTRWQKKVNTKDKIIFTRQLAIMIKGGLPLVEALQALEEQTEKPLLTSAINKIRLDVSGGISLSKALEKHPKIFPSFYIAVVSSGEKSGKLDLVLESLADQLQKDYDLMSKVKSAITYPIVIVCALVGVVILMMIFVIPKLKDIFSQMGATLPITTRIVLGASDFLVHQWYICIAIIIAIYYGIKSWAKTKKGGLFIDTFKIRVPIFGMLVQKIYLTRFARTTATLIASGLPMLDVLETDREIIGNKYYDPIFDKLSQDIESGVSLSKAIKKHKIFPVMFSHMISVGERSGKIDEILFQISDFYDKEIEITTSQLASMIEPILIILIGAGIGVVVASVIMPIYGLVNVI